jgi:predicted PurR-regulated permease PerM
MPTAPASHRDITRITLSVLAIGLLIGGSVWVLRPFLGPLLWATMIVVATWPVMTALQARLGGRRGPAVVVMTVVILLVLFVPLYLAVATIVEQADRIAALVRMLPAMRLPPPPEWVHEIPLVGGKAAESWTALAATDPQELTGRLTPYLKTALAWFGAQAGSFGSMLLHFLLTVVISAILYANGEAAADQLRRFFRRLAAERGDAIVILAGQAVRAVALGVVVTAVVQSTIAGIGMALVGIPFAGLLTAVILMLCIAQIGPIIALLPGVVWLYASGAPVRGTVLLVDTVVAGTLDNFLRPYLIRKGANLSLLLIFAGVIGGLLWLGIIGLFVGPVVLAVTSTLLDGWISSGSGEPAGEGAPAVPAVAGSGGGGGGLSAEGGQITPAP